MAVVHYADPAGNITAIVGRLSVRELTDRRRDASCVKAGTEAELDTASVHSDVGCHQDAVFGMERRNDAAHMQGGCICSGMAPCAQSGADTAEKREADTLLFNAAPVPAEQARHRTGEWCAVARESDKLDHLNAPDAAGKNCNMTAQETEIAMRIRISKMILSKGKAEQVGFEAEPVMGGDCRLEMMGGEFCGNAARSLGYLEAFRRAESRQDAAAQDGAREESRHIESAADFCSGQHTGGETVILVEVSGAKAPVAVTADLSRGTAFAEMPLPLGIETVRVSEGDGSIGRYSVIHMEGIDHLIAQNRQPDEDFVKNALEVMTGKNSKACGILFLNGKEMTPVVYVKSTDSIVWESSCGSGSVACAWYLALEELKLGETRGIPECREFVQTFLQPGGVIETRVMVQSGRITGCVMGGSIKLSEPEILEE